MNNFEHLMTGYLLGQLPEAEQARLEEQYFADPQLFAQALRVENELVDDYARGRLSLQARRQFERHYLAHPARRARAQFAQALASKLDQAGEVQSAAAAPPDIAALWWRRLLPSLSGHRLRWEVPLALASVLLIVGGLWVFTVFRRQPQESAQMQATRANAERREREAQQREREAQQPEREAQQPERDAQSQSPDERRRPAAELAAAPQRPRTEHGKAGRVRPPPAPSSRPLPAFVSLVLTAGGTRTADTAGSPAATLVIPPKTELVRLQLNLPEGVYQNYQLGLQAIGGAEIYRRHSLKPITTATGMRFNINVPARKFAAGDYMLTLTGVRADGEIDELSKSIFRVETR